MTGASPSITVPTRRTVLVTGAAAAGLACLLDAVTGAVRAQDAGADNKWRDTVDKILNGAKPVQGKISLDLPELAENGNLVPFTLTVDIPMTPADHVSRLYVISTANPQAEVAVFHLTPQSGKAAVSGRMRLSGTQEVIGIAALSNQSFLSVQKLVKVTIGGCGG